jgi:membrane protease YdiL (CAAX protease family)
MIASVLLVLILAALLVFVRDDVEEFRRFKALTSAADRRSSYRRWVLKSVLIFTAASLTALALLGRLPAILRMPAEFDPLAATLRSASHPNGGLSSSFQFFAGALIAAMVGAVGGIFIPRLFKRDAPALVGDIDALIPRDGPERLWASCLSLSAGVGEELCFRLLLPLLLCAIGLNPLPAFLGATLLFGTAHLYQGWKGIVVTTIFGGVLALVYLYTGLLLLVIVLHVFIDINGLILRPFLSGLLRRAPSAA